MVREFPSAEAFLFCYETERDFDILLLDIEMGEVSGMELAGKIRRDNSSVQIVFITGLSSPLPLAFGRSFPLIRS